VDDEFEPIESISAVTLLTVDMTKAVSFYRALGFGMLYGGPDAAFTSFRVGPGYLNLQLDPSSGPIRSIWGRIVFQVHDVDQMHGQVVAAGFTPETSPADATWGERYFHVRDPDGHELSFARPLSQKES
jgi:catechol 2,3-dioxygenase-like lactoylglutathione lyase family enzyme